MDKDRVGKFYDVVWTQYLPEYRESEKHWRLFYSPEEVQNTRVLDAGCGTGLFSVIFASHGTSQVVGIDISEGSLNTGRKLKKKFGLNHIAFQNESMLNLPFPDEHFDIVWAWGTVHHTEDPIGSIKELIRVLKRGGSILLAVYTRTRLTFVHELIRKTLIRTPRKYWRSLSRILAAVLSPVVYFFKKREKSRKGETLEELVLDWYFVPIRHYFRPQEIQNLLEKEGFTVEKFLPASGRFDSTSNFIFKARKTNP
ncbi:methyltransferase domain-containing protein [bacterium]|nr:methyltransferase domain-containing protein [bacterium]